MTSGGRAKIFTFSWATNAKGRANSGFKQSLEHIRLIEEEGYRLFTFPMKREAGSPQGEAPAKIEFITPELTLQDLVRVGDDWFAVETD